MSPVTLVAPQPSSEVAGWSAALDQVLAEPHRLRVHYQPIVDLRRGVVRGYEALARFPDAPDTPPRDWFSAAAKLGRGGALEAQVVQAALVARALLHRKRFISVNVSPAALLSPEVRAAFGRDARLDGVVVELIDRDDGADPLLVRAAIDALRTRGARIALDGVTGGRGDLARITAMRPELLKLDGASVSRSRDAEQLLETCCLLARRLGATLVVKGVETLAQLDLLVRLGVPMAQGFALGRPVAAMTELPRDVAVRIQQRTVAPTRETSLQGLLERVPAARPLARELDLAFASRGGLEHVLCVDHIGRPTGIVDRLAHERGGAPRPALLLNAGATLQEAARRAAARPLNSRFDPLVCVDDRGAPEGIVPIDRLLAALAR